MFFHNLLGSLLHRVVTYVLITAMVTTSSVPLVRQSPSAATYEGERMQLDVGKQPRLLESSLPSSLDAGLAAPESAPSAASSVSPGDGPFDFSVSPEPTSVEA